MRCRTIETGEKQAVCDEENFTAPDGSAGMSYLLDFNHKPWASRRRKRRDQRQDEHDEGRNSRESAEYSHTQIFGA